MTTSKRGRARPPGRMRCLLCGGYTRVSNTKGTLDNTIIRQRKCPNGHIFSTEEAYAGNTYDDVLRRRNGGIDLHAEPTFPHYLNTGPWYVCPSCTSAQDPNVQSVWNIETGERMGLEVYVMLDNLGKKPQEFLGILGCPEHPTLYQLPQEQDAQRIELRRFLEEKRRVPGGIQPVRE